jgi:hypothetical protein
MIITGHHVAFAVIESIYVIYILNYFKTRFSLAHPLTYFDNKLLYHPIGKSKKPICNICKLGNYGAYIISLFVLIRMIILIQFNDQLTKKMVKTFSYIVLVIVFMLSLLNFNALLYLSPYFIAEIIYLRML